MAEEIDITPKTDTADSEGVSSVQQDDSPAVGISGSDTTAETLLALAKDHRYVRYCQSLLQQVIEPYCRSDDYESETFWGAVLLYATLVVARTGRTLGMEFTGLQHQETSKRQRILGKALLFASWGLLVRRVWKRQTDTANRSSNAQELRGRARRDFHAQQRQAMLQRAASMTSGEIAGTEEGSDRTGTGRQQRIAPMVDRLCDLTSQAIQMFLQALQDPPEGPHNVVSSEAPPAISIAKWMLRLHLAHYCLTGRYPTWLHRLLGIGVRQAPSDSSKRTLTERPATTKLIGSLIFLQAGALVVKAIGKQLARVSAASATNENSYEPATVDTTPTIFHYPPSSMQPIPSSSSSTICSICRMPRQTASSAASRHCGHVFCWKCLYQWVSTVREECPFCRVACRPQDIMALYQYEPSPLAEGYL